MTQEELDRLMNGDFDDEVESAGDNNGTHETHTTSDGFDEIASLLGVQSRSVNRVVYRICRKMGIEQGSKDEFVAQIFRLDDCDTNI